MALENYRQEQGVFRFQSKPNGVYSWWWQDMLAVQRAALYTGLAFACTSAGRLGGGGGEEGEQRRHPMFCERSFRAKHNLTNA